MRPVGFALAAAIALAVPLFVGAHRLQAESVRIAPLALVDAEDEVSPEPSRLDRDLLRRLDGMPLSRCLSFFPAGGDFAPPLSFLDAARVCELGGYPYLVYGYLRKRESVYSAELKLLSREAKRIEASFFATDDREHYGRLVEDLARKISDYFLGDLGMDPGGPPPEPRRNVVELPVAAGFWTPSGPWDEALEGLFCLEAGLRLVPLMPLAGLKSRPLYLGIGLRGEYAVGRARPECETARLHRLLAKLPLEIFLCLDAESSLGLALGGVAEFDILRQERAYSGPYGESRSAGGLSASAAYRYALSDRLRLGLTVEYERVFYSEPLTTLASRLCLEYAFPDPARPR